MKNFLIANIKVFGLPSDTQNVDNPNEINKNIQAKIRLVHFSVYCVMLLSLVTTIPKVSEASVDKVTIDSLTSTHTDRFPDPGYDKVRGVIIYEIMTNNAKGSWSIEEMKSGEIVAQSDNIAEGTASATADPIHTLGTSVYFLTAFIYTMPNKTTVPGTTKYKESGQHSI